MNTTNNEIIKIATMIKGMKTFQKTPDGFGLKALGFMNGFCLGFGGGGNRFNGFFGFFFAKKGLFAFFLTNIGFFFGFHLDFFGPPISLCA